MAEVSIAQLRIYQLAHRLEDNVYELVKGLPEEQFYPLGNDLRRASAAAAHYIAQAHRSYSYQLKLESLHAARSAAEDMGKLLERVQQEGFGDTKALAEDYTTLIKQNWGLIKYLKNRQAEKQTAAIAAAKDELVAARSA